MAVFYLNGLSVLTQNIGSFTPLTAFDLFLGRRPAAGFGESFQGLIDEPSVYNRDLSALEIQSIFVAGAAYGGPALVTVCADNAPPQGALSACAIFPAVFE